MEVKSIKSLTYWFGKLYMLLVFKTLSFVYKIANCYWDSYFNDIFNYQINIIMVS